MIPSGANSRGVDFAAIIRKYIDTLHFDHVAVCNAPFIRTGKKAVNSKPSTFINSPMGKNYISNVGKDIASFLGLDFPERYTGHCFRRTSATQMANEGATVMEMRQTFGWENDKMPNVYVANSTSKMKKTAKMLTGVDVNQNQGAKRKSEANLQSESEPPPKAQNLETLSPTSLFNGTYSIENCTINVSMSK